MKHGKKYVDAAKLVDRTKLYDTNEALDTVIKTAVAKFDETVELHVKLGVDSRHADQQVRGAVVLPNGTGKKVRVLAICKGANEELAKEAGADFVGAEDMTQKIQQENWMDFDVLTVLTKQTSFTAQSVRQALALRSSVKTLTLSWALS